MHRASTFDLSTLLNTDGPGAFLGAYWPHTLFVGHGPRARLGGLFRIPELRTGAAFLNAWKSDVTAWPRLKTADTIETIHGRQLSRCYKKGFTLYLTQVEDEVPAVVPFLRRIERDLGLRRGDMTCAAILSRKGAGAVAHFDADCTFNIQLEGKKRWRAEPNRAVAFPHRAGTMGMPVHAEMASVERDRILSCRHV